MARRGGLESQLSVEVGIASMEHSVGVYRLYTNKTKRQLKYQKTPVYLSKI
jgi:hypothetical protein